MTETASPPISATPAGKRSLSTTQWELHLHSGWTEQTCTVAGPRNLLGKPARLVGNRWGPCSALEPSEEVCDYQDNDCNGIVDDPFVNENGYGTVEHCGACNLNCNTVFPNATTPATTNWIPRYAFW